MLNEQEDVMFGEKVISLNLITPKRLQDCINLQKQWFFEGDQLSLQECLLRFEYLTLQQIKIVQQEIAIKPNKHKVLKNFGRYQIILEIGRGSMGVVNKAYDPQLKRVIAIKILQNKGHDDVDRFTREAKATARLAHPNIVEVYDIGCFDRKYFYAMDYIEGLSLEELLKKKKLTIKNSLQIIKEVCEGIAYAHENKVIHRDLKPANIMIDKNGKPKVMDFGLAKIIDEHDELSKSGMIIGTLQYMSPEQAEGKIHLVGKHSDVYSIGAILYEMLTNRVTFSGNSFAQVIDQILYKVPTSLTQIKKIIPIELEHICLKALEKKPENRYTDVAALLLDISNFIEGKSIVAPKMQLRVKETFLQAKYYKKRIFVMIIIIILLISSCFITPNYKIQENTKKTTSYIKKEIKKLTSYTDFLYCHEKEPYVFQENDYQKLQESIKKYTRLDVLIYKKVHISSASNNIKKWIQEIKKEIILQSYLNNNEFVATVHLQSYKMICDESTFLNFQQDIARSQEEIKEKFIKRIKYVMDRLEKQEEFFSLFANEFSKMPIPYILETIIFYLDSDILLQRILAIRTLGVMQNPNIKINKQDICDYLIKRLVKFNNRLKKIDSIENDVEIDEILMSLIYIGEEKAIKAVHFYLSKIAPFSILWEEVITKYHALLNIPHTIKNDKKEEFLKQNILHYLENIMNKKNSNILEWKDSAFLKNIKRVDTIVKQEKKYYCYTLLFLENARERKILAISQKHAFFFYNEQESLDDELVNAIDEYINDKNISPMTNAAKKVTRIQIKFAGRSNIFKKQIIFQYTSKNKELKKESRWFYIMSIAEQNYIIAVSK